MNWKLLGIFFFVVVGGLCLIWGIVFARPRIHEFEGKCQICHEAIPATGTPFEDVILKDDAERLCANCHTISQRTSHPVGVKPRTSIPLQRFLDKEGRLTCLTCHDVHKERKSADDREGVEGLLRGHTRGRNFCFVCHNDDILGAKWRHNLVVNYAHSPGRLSQKMMGGPLDEYSVECLSCHDGIISKINTVVVKSGSFEHSIGLSHPVGVEYPTTGRDDEFMPRNNLPEEIKLFNGTVGCLSCHNPYDNKKSYLVMSNFRSALCLTCHRK